MAIQGQLNGMTTGQVLDAAAQVRSMQQTPGWRLLHGLVEVEAERVLTRMLNSTPAPEKLAQYQGELRGLKALAGLCESVLTYAQEREAEEQQLVGGS